MITESTVETEWAGSLCIIKASAMSYIKCGSRVFWLGGQARSNGDIFRYEIWSRKVTKISNYCAF